MLRLFERLSPPHHMTRRHAVTANKQTGSTNTARSRRSATPLNTTSTGSINKAVDHFVYLHIWTICLEEKWLQLHKMSFFKMSFCSVTQAMSQFNSSRTSWPTYFCKMYKVCSGSDRGDRTYESLEQVALEDVNDPLDRVSQLPVVCVLQLGPVLLQQQQGPLCV